MVQVLRVIVEHIERHGYPPSLEEIGDALEPPVSRARAGQLVDALVEARRLERDDGVSRGLRLPRLPRSCDPSSFGPGR
jgi:SOS-response transcriptional repressor LexA